MMSIEILSKRAEVMCRHASMSMGFIGFEDALTPVLSITHSAQACLVLSLLESSAEPLNRGISLSPVVASSTTCISAFILQAVL